ncbi:MAG: AraC family transcriptional regulator [Lachnospiraceae bacterium]|nr:AraC family transcriptional regulator [Lachnospiraceae bacterium]
MHDILFSIFPNEKFIDLGLLQYGWERCEPAHMYGPAARNHYLFHYIISGTGSLMAQNKKGETITYNIRSGQGFLLFPGQISTYIADEKTPWEYAWLEFDGLKVKEMLEISGFSLDQPVYHAVSKEFRDTMMTEMLYIANHSNETPFHLIGHLYLFLDALTRSMSTIHMNKAGKMSDYYIQESINYMEQNFPYEISIEDIASHCGINRSYFGKIFHASVGKSPQEFLISYRMMKAAELLKMTDFSIADIGNAVGYPNQLHFSRAFKNVYGVSPKNWRNQHK